MTLRRVPVAHLPSTPPPPSPQAWIRGGADIGLVDLTASHLTHRHHVVRATQAGDEGLQGGSVDLVVLIVGGIGVGAERNPIGAALLRHQETFHSSVGGRTPLWGPRVRPPCWR